MPEIMTLGNLSLKECHWEEISNTVGFVMNSNQRLTLGKILSFKLSKFVPLFEIISDGATKESSLEKKLNLMMADWNNLSFNLVDYKYTFD
jgi:dynein heavy chain